MPTKEENAHLVGLVIAILAWRGHNVRLSLFTRWAERGWNRVR